MIEPFEVVYVSRRRNKGSYHRAAARFGVRLVWTACTKLRLDDCDQLLEVTAVLTNEPCRRCFPLRGRRQRILDQLAEVDVEGVA